MAKNLSIIIPTRDRCQILRGLLDSIKGLRSLNSIQPELIVADNGSKDETWTMLQQATREFSIPFVTISVSRPGKSAAVNEAIRAASGEFLAFLDDDVVLDSGWLEAVWGFFEDRTYPVGQGVIRLPAHDSQNPEILKLLQRYRTIPNLEYGPEVEEVSSLNGANIAVHRKVFDQIGSFDERLGPGASGTSEDKEIARRITQAGMRIGYMNRAIVYHRVDRPRLTEAYFKSVHQRQGRSRALFKQPSTGRVLFDLARASVQYGLYSLIGKERKKYRNKGRLYHYLGMLEIKLKPGGKG
jgi:glycosyltransferase involved in cell wall biosynthesis